MRTFICNAFVLALAVSGCGGANDNSPPPPPALPICSAALPSSAMPSPAATGLTGDALADSGVCTEVSTALTRATAPADIVPTGYVALGPAIAFAGPAMAYPHGIDFVLPADLAGKGPANAPASRIVVFEQRGSAPVTMIPASNVLYEAPWKRLHFHALGFATYQAAVPATAGTMTTRHYTFRALAGPSMGGLGSSLNFWLHPERYDAVATMGADPGPDLTYTLGSLKDWMLGGFCTAKDGLDKIGKLCPSTRKPLADQGEVPYDFEHMPYQKGEGVGLTASRSFFLRAFRDVFRAFGNPAYATDPNSKDPTAGYLPPGVPPSTLAMQPADACAHPTVLKGFFDDRYNPDGKYDVITFCDGQDSQNLGLGVFDPSLPPRDPAQILLAVDVNGNGARDSGEPVLFQGSERFDDFGADGLPDPMEPGYDPVTNPDPNHDDYHWLHNPTGTEGNWRWDAGEKYSDCGTDGVCGKGCTVGTGANCYDYGEGNGQFDYAPGLTRMRDQDPRSRVESMPAAEFAHLDTYYDAGIRDFFSDFVSTNSLMGALESRGQSVRVFDGFPALVGAAPSQEMKFEANSFDFAPLGRHVYVRYGDPDAPEDVVEETGDGRHVGDALQAVHRVQVLFYFLSNVWPNGDTDVPDNLGDPQQIDDMFTAKNGRVTTYTIVLPPGYNDPDKQDKRYPIVYMFHGLGMDPSGFGQLAAIAGSAMVNTSVPAARRLQKMIIVIADGHCAPGGDISNGPLPMTGDLCEEGAYYTDHPTGAYQGSTQLLELEDLIESKYRVKAAADLPYVE